MLEAEVHAGDVLVAGYVVASGEDMVIVEKRLLVWWEW